MPDRNLAAKHIKGKKQVRAYAYSRDMLNRVVGERTYKVVSFTGKTLAEGVTIEAALRSFPRCKYHPEV